MAPSCGCYPSSSFYPTAPHLQWALQGVFFGKSTTPFSDDRPPSLFNHMQNKQNIVLHVLEIIKTYLEIDAK
jgi:hypothetical protein